MNMSSRNQYLKALIEKRGYLLLSKKDKGRLLDEYCKTTGQNRSYVVRKIRRGRYLFSSLARKKRREKYDERVRLALVSCWRIFDYPCGQRLEPLLKQEVDRLRELGELNCSDKVARKLKEIDKSTIDEKLKHQKEVERIARKYRQKVHPLLYQKIPVRIYGEQDRTSLGNLQLDLVEHCGQSASGEFIHTLSSTDISSGWWEGEAVFSRGQEPVFVGLTKARSRYPLKWQALHSDNDSAFINWHLYEYCQKEGLEFSRSRPSRKNDNCFVEQKNWTHVKKFVGYLRYDRQGELEILNDLYRNELRLYKNFFQPVIKLISKERMGGRIHRRYDYPKTPYQRLMEAEEVSKETKEQLKQTYLSLNPARLKRTIDHKLDLLWKAYQRKKHSSLEANSSRKLKPNSFTFYIRHQDEVHLPG